jgi:O-acetyl-ADP-ribose deacetylase (regulator of RNase III)
VGAGSATSVTATTADDSRIRVATGDITTLDVDAIVNAANNALARGGGVCGAIFRAAGPQLDAACSAIGQCPTGEARITPGFALKAKWIVHAVGPVWHGGAQGEAALLASAYRESLRLAQRAGAASMAFPAISTGIYGYPRGEAAQIAVRTIREWCSNSPDPELIVFCCFTSGDARLYEAQLDA